MKKLKIICFVIVTTIILIIPVVILANSNMNNNENTNMEETTVVIGSKSVNVIKEKTREERVAEKFAMAKEYEKNKKIKVSSYYSNGKDTDNVQDLDLGQEDHSLERNLENIVKKNNKENEFEEIITTIQRKEQTGIFTNEHKKLCELFIDIYKSNSLTDDEVKEIEKFLEIVEFNDIDDELKTKVNELINR